MLPRSLQPQSAWGPGHTWARPSGGHGCMRVLTGGYMFRSCQVKRKRLTQTWAVWGVETRHGTTWAAISYPSSHCSWECKRFMPFSVLQLELAGKWEWGALQSGLDSRASKGTTQTTAETKRAGRSQPPEQSLTRCARLAFGGLGGRDVFPLRWPVTLKYRNPIGSHGGVVV